MVISKRSAFTFGLAVTAWLVTAIVIANRDIVVTSNGNDYFDGGGGVDTIVFKGQIVPVWVDLLQGRAVGEGIGSDRLVNLENIVGGAGSDRLHGDTIDNLIQGLDGDDEIAGREGNDTLEGGPGDDVLVGGTGNDRYIMRAGDGFDHIVEGFSGGGKDVLVFETPGAKMDLQRWGSALLISLTTGESIDRVVVWDHFLSPDARLDEIEVNGETWEVVLWTENIEPKSDLDCTLLWLINDCPSRPSPEPIDFDPDL